MDYDPAEVEGYEEFNKKYESLLKVKRNKKN